MVSTWQETVSAVQKHRLAGLSLIEPPLPDLPDQLPRDVTNIPRQLLSQQERELTESSPEVLLKRLASGEWSSEKVINAFLRRAGLAQSLVKLTLCLDKLGVLLIW